MIRPAAGRGQGLFCSACAGYAPQAGERKRYAHASPTAPFAVRVCISTDTQDPTAEPAYLDLPVLRGVLQDACALLRRDASCDGASLANALTRLPSRTLPRSAVEPHACGFAHEFVAVYMSLLALMHVRTADWASACATCQELRSYCQQPRRGPTRDAQCTAAFALSYGLAAIALLEIASEASPEDAAAASMDAATFARDALEICRSREATEQRTASTHLNETCVTLAILYASLVHDLVQRMHVPGLDALRMLRVVYAMVCDGHTDEETALAEALSMQIASLMLQHNACVSHDVDANAGAACPECCAAAVELLSPVAQRVVTDASRDSPLSTWYRESADVKQDNGAGPSAGPLSVLLHMLRVRMTALLPQVRVDKPTPSLAVCDMLPRALLPLQRHDDVLHWVPALWGRCPGWSLAAQAITGCMASAVAVIGQEATTRSRMERTGVSIHEATGSVGELVIAFEACVAETRLARAAELETWLTLQGCAASSVLDEACLGNVVPAADDSVADGPHGMLVVRLVLFAAVHALVANAVLHNWLARHSASAAAWSRAALYAARLAHGPLRAPRTDATRLKYPGMLACVTLHGAAACLSAARPRTAARLSLLLLEALGASLPPAVAYAADQTGICVHGSLDWASTIVDLLQHTATVEHAPTPTAPSGHVELAQVLHDALHCPATLSRDDAVVSEALAFNTLSCAFLMLDNHEVEASALCVAAHKCSQHAMMLFPETALRPPGTVASAAEFLALKRLSTLPGAAASCFLGRPLVALAPLPQHIGERATTVLSRPDLRAATSPTRPALAASVLPRMLPTAADLVIACMQLVVTHNAVVAADTRFIIGNAAPAQLAASSPRKPMTPGSTLAVTRLASPTRVASLRPASLHMSMLSPRASTHGASLLRSPRISEAFSIASSPRRLGTALDAVTLSRARLTKLVDMCNALELWVDAFHAGDPQPADVAWVKMFQVLDIIVQVRARALLML